MQQTDNNIFWKSIYSTKLAIWRPNLVKAAKLGFKIHLRHSKFTNFL